MRHAGAGGRERRVGCPRHGDNRLGSRGMTSLDGKRAIVTGASSGIGEATAHALEEAGARVYAGSRSAGNLDVRDRESSERFVRDALAELGGLDILVNNAGLSRGRDP